MPKRYNKNMEIRVLRYYLAVVQQGSIVKAANYLHLTQPTLSRQLQDLERELNQKLLIRGKRKVSLTPEGELFKKRAQEIIQLVDKTKNELSSSIDNIKGDIFIGSGESKTMEYIAKVIKEIRIEYPDIKFHIYSGNAEDVTEKLDKGLLDFGILIQPVDIYKYDYLKLPKKDRWGVVLRKDSALAKKPYIKLEDLKGLPLLNSRQAMRKTFAKNEFIDWFQEEFDNLNTAATFNLVYNAAIMVKAGIGYAITLDKLVDTSLDSELCFKPLYPKLESALDIVWKKNQVFSSAAKLFLNKLRENIINKK